MKYINVSPAILQDLLTAKSQINDIRALVNDQTFRPNALEWREYLLQIINTTRYIPEDEEG